MAARRRRSFLDGTAICRSSTPAGDAEKTALKASAAIGAAAAQAGATGPLEAITSGVAFSSFFV
jgi:hypothetical protein